MILHGRRRIEAAARWFTAHWRSRADLLNAEYEAGKWDYLGQLGELPRYSVLAGYLVYLKPGGAILDVGCGEGVLLSRMQPYGYSKYVGVDLSSGAIARLAERQSERQLFVVADGEHYAPTEHFDVVVFNEVLYSFRDPVNAVARYVPSLRRGGILLVSMCSASEAAPEILARLKTMYPVVHETKVSPAGKSWSWVCTVFAPERCGEDR